MSKHLNTEATYRLIEQLEPCEYDRVLSIVSCFLETHGTRLSDECITKVMYCKELNINDITMLVSFISRVRNVRARTFFNDSASLYYVEHPEVVESYKRDIAVDDSIIFKLSNFLSGFEQDITEEPQEHSEDVADTEPQEQEEEPQVQEREERVDCGVTFYYDDGSSYSREFRFTSNGIVFNLHRDHISFDDPQHDSFTVFNVFNLQNAEKIVTIDVSFLPCDDEDDELSF